MVPNLKRNEKETKNSVSNNTEDFYSCNSRQKHPRLERREFLAPVPIFPLSNYHQNLIQVFHQRSAEKYKNRQLSIVSNRVQRELLKHFDNQKRITEKNELQQLTQRTKVGARFFGLISQEWRNITDLSRNIMRIHFEVKKKKRDIDRQENLLNEMDSLTQKLAVRMIRHDSSKNFQQAGDEVPSNFGAGDDQMKDQYSNSIIGASEKSCKALLPLDKRLSLLDTDSGRRPLRDYQSSALLWLINLYESKLNGILADEMGLGKTVQTIALLSYLAEHKNDWGPHLIVVPTTVLLNWDSEFKRWCPGLKVLTYMGLPKERKQLRFGWTNEDAFHVCLTSYNIVRIDRAVFRRRPWGFLILDEAHQIKNFASAKWRSLFDLQAEFRLLLTGTPLQNSIMELWSLLHFLLPSVQAFQSHDEFREWYSNPIDAMVRGDSHLQEEVVRRLHSMLRPFILRRLKVDVEKQLPSKSEKVVLCRLSRRQRLLYDDFMQLAETKQKIAIGGHGGILSVILSLRKVCDHPDLFEPRNIESPFMCSQDYQINSINLLVPSCSLLLDNSNKGYFVFGRISIFIDDVRLNESEGFSSKLSTEYSAHNFSFDYSENRTYSNGLAQEQWYWMNTDFLKCIHIHDDILSFLVNTATPFSDIESQATRFQKFPSNLSFFPPGANATSPKWLRLEASNAISQQRRLFQYRTQRTLRFISSQARKRSMTSHLYIPSCCYGISSSPFSFFYFPLQWVPSILDRISCLTPLIAYIAFYIPAVVTSRGPSLYALKRVSHWRPFCSLDRRSLVPFVNTCNPFSFTRSLYNPIGGNTFSATKVAAELWPFQIRRCFSFPDKRLLIHDCGKFQFLEELLKKCLQEGHRALIFTQFVKMLNLLETFLALIGVAYLRIDGSTRPEVRQQCVERFNRDELITCMILSTRSGGIGLNLTGADTVIFYDSDWNPTMDLQAQDRCHRIGQTRPVTIYRLISEHTIEEGILRKARERKKLNNLVIRGGQFYGMTTLPPSVDSSEGIDNTSKEWLNAIVSLSSHVTLRNFFHDFDEDVQISPDEHGSESLGLTSSDEKKDNSCLLASLTDALRNVEDEEDCLAQDLVEAEIKEVRQMNDEIDDNDDFSCDDMIKQSSDCLANTTFTNAPLQDQLQSLRASDNLQSKRHIPHLCQSVIPNSDSLIKEQQEILLKGLSSDIHVEMIKLCRSTRNVELYTTYRHFVDSYHSKLHGSMPSFTEVILEADDISVSHKV